MKILACKRCQKIRIGLYAIIGGSLAGALAIKQGVAPDISMMATFFGAIIPVLWYSRANRNNK